MGEEEPAGSPESQQPKTTRVLIGEDSYLVREGMRRLFDHELEIRVIGAVSDYDSLLKEVEELRPDVEETEIHRRVMAVLMYFKGRRERQM